jgi:hypothetical protein
MKVRIVAQPTGLLNGREWPTPGEELDVHDVVGADLCASGAAVPVVEDSTEKRPAVKRAEKR